MYCTNYHRYLVFDKLCDVYVWARHTFGYSYRLAWGIGMSECVWALPLRPNLIVPAHNCLIFPEYYGDTTLIMIILYCHHTHTHTHMHMHMHMHTPGLIWWAMAV